MKTNKSPCRLYLLAVATSLIFSHTFVLGAPIVVYDQPSVFDSLGVGGLTAAASTNGFSPTDAFDNFSLPDAAEISRVEWQGFYAPDNANKVQDVAIRFFEDDSGMPGSLLFENIVVGGAGENLVGVKFFTPDPPTPNAPPGDVSVYDYGVDLGTSFLTQAGETYWLQIQPTVDFPPFWAWHFGSGGDLLTVQDFEGVRTLNPGTSDLAFKLVSVPLPAALPMFILSLVSLIRIERKNA